MKQCGRCNNDAWGMLDLCKSCFDKQARAAVARELPDIEADSGSKITRVAGNKRRDMLLACSRNRRWKKAGDRQRQEKLGPGGCHSCGAQPCGHLWPEDKCCAGCTHEPMEGWAATHVLWTRSHSYFVMEQPGSRRMQQSLYYRADGVIEWVRKGFWHYFLGRQIALPDFARFRIDDRGNALEEDSEGRLVDEILDAAEAEFQESERQRERRHASSEEDRGQRRGA